MTEIPIYDSKGIQVDSITIKESVEYVNGRVCRSDTCYYKGIGIPYTSHNIMNENLNDDYDFLEKSTVFYVGNVVSKKSFQNKTGIFQERFQPQFTDWIGSCGFKELNILENLYDEHKFERNSIEVLSYETINEEAQQYYLKVQYSCGRKTYANYPNPSKLRELLDYMISANWNFPWDKDAIADISTTGLVTDVADIFYSTELVHKIGTVYSVLYSLGTKNTKLYNEFCNSTGLRNVNDMDYIFNTIFLLSVNGVNTSPLMDIEDPIEIYKNVVKNYLIQGKNCGFCGVGSCLKKEDSNQSYGEMIKQEYIQRVNEMLK
jgi:hypothetical protein